MKHILQVLKFEYLTCIKNKGFIVTTIILMALIILLACIPLIISAFTESDNGSDENADTENVQVIAVQNKVYDEKVVNDSFKDAFKDYSIKMTDANTSIDEIKSQVDSGTYTFAVIIDKNLSYKFVTKNNSLFSDESTGLDNTIKKIYRVSAFEKQGISQTESQKILDEQITSETITTGKDETKNYIPTYVLLMVLYMAIVMYGQMVSQSVVTEKNTRTMEMLITCAKPTHLMFGKVIGSGLAGLTQLVLIIVTLLTSVTLIASQSIPQGIMDYISLPISTVIYAFIFFILGYFIYSFLLGALSSLASRSEDLSTLTTPVMLLLVAAFFVVIFSLDSSSGVNSPLMVVCSYIPFTAPITMFVRVSTSDVAFYEIIISIVVQAVSVYLIGLLAAGIYKIGVLMYGNPPKPAQIVKLLLDQRKQSKASK